MDAQRIEKNYFAVNPQFVNFKHEFTIATVAVRDTENQCSSAFIKTLVKNVSTTLK